MFWDVLKLIFYLIIFGVIIFAAYYSCKKLAVHSSNFGGSRYMKIIDRIVLNKDAAIILLKMGDKYLLVSQSSGGIGLIREFTEEEFDAVDDLQTVENKIENPISGIFDNILSGKIFTMNKKRSGGNLDNSNGSEGFGFLGFRKKDPNDGEILGRYDGDIEDVKDMDFNEILNRGISRSKRKTNKDFDSRKEEKDVAETDEE